MASILGRLVRPSITLTTKFNKTAILMPTHGTFNLTQCTKLMSTASNYHYHQPPPSHAHDKLWKAERYLSLALLGVLPAAAVVSHPIMDHAVALSLVVHIHWGVEAIVTDYIRPSIFGPVIPKVSIAIVYLLSSLAVGGLFVFNYTDVGITQATRMLAKI